MVWKTSSYSESSVDYSRNQAPYAPPQASRQTTHLRSVNYATAHSGTPWNFCSACGEKLEHDANFCHECGTDVHKVQLVADLIPTKCACKRVLKKEFKFCPGCKAVVDKTWETANACTCGAVIQIEANACVACGKKTNDATSKRKAG